MNPLLVLQARAEARALLYAAGEYVDEAEAMWPLIDDAFNSGLADEIGVEAVVAIVHKAFEGIAEK